jgi:predicted methyltransferase
VSSISLNTGRAAVLHPLPFVKGPPTVVLGSLAMHRTGGANGFTSVGPAEDTRRKLDAVKMKKVYGKVGPSGPYGGLGWLAFSET